MTIGLRVALNSLGKYEVQIDYVPFYCPNSSQDALLRFEYETRVACALRSCYVLLEHCTPNTD